MIRRIVVVQVVLYLLLALIDEVLTLVSPMRWWDAGSLLAFQPTIDYLVSHPWTLLTYIIPHDSLLQLIGVCLLLTLIDRTLQEQFPPQRVLGLYLYGALAGALGDLLCYYLGVGLGLWTPLPLELVGAQPAALSLLSASLTLHIRRGGSLREHTAVGAGLVLLLAVISLGASSWRAGLGGHPLAYIGGIICGIVYALLLCRGIDLTAPIAKPLRYIHLYINSRLGSPEVSPRYPPEDGASQSELRHSDCEPPTRGERRRVEQIGRGDTKPTH